MDQLISLRLARTPGPAAAMAQSSTLAAILEKVSSNDKGAYLGSGRRFL
jgi:hypothetical protein